MPTTIKAALKKWEETTGKKASEATEVRLIGVFPPIGRYCQPLSDMLMCWSLEKMDSYLSCLIACEKLCLSTNMITSLNNLQHLKHLKILSLGRNLIKSLAGQLRNCIVVSLGHISGPLDTPYMFLLSGIEAVGETLEQLWISYNKIDKLGPLAKLTKLNTLYMAHNMVK